MAVTVYLDPVNGSDSNAGTSFAAALATVNGCTSGKGVGAGTTIRVAKSPDYAALGVNGTFTNKSATITLSAAKTVTLYKNGAWTAEANVTATTVGGSSNKSNQTTTVQLATNGSFSIGMLAYYATGSLSITGYQKLSLWVKANAAITAGALIVTLCSDTAGATPLYSITIPYALRANAWTPITIDNGSAFSGTVQSIALTTFTGMPTKTFWLDNIFVTNDLSLTSLISKDSGTTVDGPIPVRYVDGTTVLTDGGVTTPGNGSYRGYSGTAETVALYYREPVRITSTQTSVVAGSLGSPVTYSGGWDTGSNTQTGETWWDFGDGNISGVSLSQSYSSSTHIAVVRASTGFSVGGTGATVDTPAVVNGASIGVSPSGTFNQITSPAISFNASLGANVSGNGCVLNITGAKSNTSVGVLLGSAACGTTGTVTNLNNNAGSGLDLGTGGGRILTCGTFNDNGGNGILCTDSGLFTVLGTTSCSNNSSPGIGAQGPMYIQNLTTSGNTTAAISVQGGDVRIGVASISEATIVSFTGEPYANGSVAIQKYGGTVGDTRIYKGTGTVLWQTTTRHTASGRAINLQPNSSATSSYPLWVDSTLSAFDSTASTCKIYTQRDDTSVVNSLVLKGGQMVGVSSDVSASGSAAINTWEQLTISFTATDDNSGCRFRLQAHAAGAGGHNAYFDDSTVS